MCRFFIICFFLSFIVPASSFLSPSSAPSRLSLPLHFRLEKQTLTKDSTTILNQSKSVHSQAESIVSKQSSRFHLNKIRLYRTDLGLAAASTDANSNDRNGNKNESNLVVMVNGLPGKMGKDVTLAAMKRGLEICPWAMTGNLVEDDSVTLSTEIKETGEKVTQDIRLVKGPQTEKGDENCDNIMVGLKAGYESVGKKLIVIDYTHPSAVNLNSKFYARHELNYVMGTTGGNREQLFTDTKNANLYAIIAPNMGKQIVALQATLEKMAEDFPGSFAGYTLDVEESHQSSKADTSGTAKALVGSMGKLIGTPYNVEDIKLIREPKAQMDFGVPEEALAGHAYHTYRLISPDKSTEIQFRHNVVGRTIYAEGTIDAAIFLHKRESENNSKKIYDMVDVLKAGGM